MSRMVRKQIYIEPRQEETLKRKAREMGITEAELIRRAIDQVGDVYPLVRPNLQAWEEEKEYIREHRRMDVAQTGRTWTRDELYEERLERFSR